MCPSHLVHSQFKCTCFVFIKLHQKLYLLKQQLGCFHSLNYLHQSSLKEKKGQFCLSLKLNPLQRKVSRVHTNTHTHTPVLTELVPSDSDGAPTVSPAEFIQEKQQRLKQM